MNSFENADAALTFRLQVTADICDDIRAGNNPLPRIQNEWMRLTENSPDPETLQSIELLHRFLDVLHLQSAQRADTSFVLPPRSHR